MVNFVRRFIKNYAEITGPLVELTKKGCEQKHTFAKAWGPEQSAAFDLIKRVLTTTPVLKFPDFSKEFVVHTDASDISYGGF